MDRRKFFRGLGTLSAAALVAPSIIAAKNELLVDDKQRIDVSNCVVKFTPKDIIGMWRRTGTLPFKPEHMI